MSDDNDDIDDIDAVNRVWGGASSGCQIAVSSAASTRTFLGEDAERNL